MTMIDPMPPPVPAAATSPSARPGTPDFLRWLQASAGRDGALPDAAQPSTTQQAVPPASSRAGMAESAAMSVSMQPEAPALDARHALSASLATPAAPPGLAAPHAQHTHGPAAPGETSLHASEPLAQSASLQQGAMAAGLLEPGMPESPVVVSEPVDIARLFDLAQRADVGALWASGADEAMTDWLPAGQLALRLRGGDGQEALMALPWRLAANGRLEHAALLMQPLWLAQGTQPPGMSMPAAGAAMPGSPAAVAAAQAGAHAAGGTAPMLPVQSAGDAVRSARTAPTEDAATLARAPTFGEWALRWTRWIERDGRDPAVWLRDFRLDEQGVRRLTDTLRAFAREQGFTLERIVVNGREQWREADAQPYATSFPQHQE